MHDIANEEQMEKIYIPMLRMDGTKVTECPSTSSGVVGSWCWCCAGLAVNYPVSINIVSSHPVDSLLNIWMLMTVTSVCT